MSIGYDRFLHAAQLQQAPRTPNPLRKIKALSKQCPSGCYKNSTLAQAQQQAAPKSPRPSHMERKAAQLRAELEVHRDALAAADMEVALLGEQLVQSRGRVQVGFRVWG